MSSVHCRAPHGARGLKLYVVKFGTDEPRRAPHGARGLKLTNDTRHVLHGCRAPHGARGLKPRIPRHDGRQYGSRPAWGAWIETSTRITTGSSRRSRPAWGAWIETISTPPKRYYLVSRPARGAWIETYVERSLLRMLGVAPRMERLD